MSYTTEFLAKNNKNFRNIVEAVTPRGILAAMQEFSAVEMVQVAMMSPLVHNGYTEKVRKITGDFSVLVVRDTIGKSDNEYLVIRCDSSRGLQQHYRVLCLPGPGGLLPG